MSTQSGITASNQVLDAFKTVKSNNSPLIIRVNKDNTELEVDPDFSHSTSDLFLDVANYLYDTQPHSAYLVIPVNNGDDAIFASYIPDDAPIREKMLYASTKSTLLTQLGSGNFKKPHVFAWSEIKEVSQENFDRETKVSQLDSPLTEEEKLLQQIKSLQSFSIAELLAKQHDGFKRQLASMHDTSPATGTGAGVSTGSSGLAFKLSSELESSFKSFSKPHHLLTFAIDLATETVNLTSSVENVSPDNLIEKLTGNTSSEAHPQYGLYSYNPESAAFIYSCPSGSKVKERMVYASSKKNLVEYIKSNIGFKIDKNLEVGDLDELDLREFEDQKEETTTNRLKFNKPKGPRRR